MFLAFFLFFFFHFFDKFSDSFSVVAVDIDFELLLFHGVMTLFIEIEGV